MIRERRRILKSVIALLLALVFAREAQPAGVGVSLPGDEPAGTVTDTLFFPNRPGAAPNTRMRRDLEFLLTARYSIGRGDAIPGFSGTDLQTLERFGNTLVESPGFNIFGAPYSDIHLIHDYFSPESKRYNPNPLETGFQIGIVSDPVADRRHADFYLYEDGQAGKKGGSYTSLFSTAKEDSSTGHWQSPTQFQILPSNSLMFPGPTRAALPDVGGNGWTAPNRAQNWGFVHEFQHSLPGQSTGTALTELFSTAAEVGGGALPEDASVFDFSYTWNLLGNQRAGLTGEPSPTNIRAIGNNYSAWRLLMAYLLLNFRNQDTTATLRTDASLGGFTDDLVYRWSRSTRTLGDLRNRLSNDSCWTCSQKAYFNPGGTPLPTYDRLQLLLHNWRVATYVNNSFLPGSEGRYGYPPHFGFKPGQDVGAWQNNDGFTSDDAVAIPPELTATTAWISRDTSLVGGRSASPFYPLILQPLGSEYWVIRSSAGIPQGTDLVVRVDPMSLYRDALTEDCSQFGGEGQDGRLFLSVAGYKTQGTDLWNHPEWADTVYGAVWVDVDSVGSPLELILPGFGSRFKAAVIVMTLQDGPMQGWAGSSGTQGEIPAYREALKYHVNLTLRRAPFESQNPSTFAATGGSIEDHPAWSPGGTELVYRAIGPSNSQIYRKPIGGSATPLISRPHDQQTPDWSPRGDWVGFAEDPDGNCDHIYAYNVQTLELRQLTSGIVLDLYPVFQPNGQRLAYVRTIPGALPQQWEIRRIDLAGANNVAVLNPPLQQPIVSPRWSKDGQQIYFSAGNRLYSVPVTGGAATPQDSVFLNVSSFDLPVGRGPIVAEEAGSMDYKCGTPKTISFRRVALRDTLTNPRDLDPRFYRTGARFFMPRLSWDNTRIAYVSDQNGSSERDLFLGQITFDHAPAFNTLSDRTSTAGQPLSIDLTATDPDGDGLTYSGAYLPAGSSINGSTFSWSNPQPAGTDYYIVFRAADAGGAVANKVIKLTLIQGGGGCPFVDVRTASGWEEDNSILGRSLTGDLQADYYRLRAIPEERDGVVEIRIRENEEEVTTLDRVSLVAVNHDPATRAFAMGDEIVIGSRRAATRVLRASGEEITSLVNGSSIDGFVGEPGETLLVERAPHEHGSKGTPIVSTHTPYHMDDDDKGGGGKILPGVRPESVNPIDAAVLRETGILLQVPDGAGGWQTVVHRYPREHRDEYVNGGVPEGPLRIVFLGRHRIRFIGEIVPSGETVELQNLRLLGATHSRLGSVASTVASGDGTSLSVTPGDTLTLRFAVPHTVEGKVRDFFVRSLGVYSSIVPSDSRSPIGESPSPSWQFSLGPARPNPTTGRVAFSYSLASEADARMRIYDVAGRLLKDLVDGVQAAGPHEVVWDGRTNSGDKVPAGVYFYRLEAGGWHSERKLIVITQ